MDASSPIFVHSLFRAGSTYVYNCFRRSSAGYWCYHEPLNEYLANAVAGHEILLTPPEGKNAHLRHPSLTRPYFYEFSRLADQIASSFQTSFSYSNYFSNALDEPLCRYLSALVAGARGRPMFQECRSSGRVQGIRECLGGLHIFLWRNPWDQWWSYKVDSHFEICNLQILTDSSAPPFLADLRELLEVQAQGSDLDSLIAQRLDAAGSYMLFFALWAHAMLEALPLCDLDINIDSLSHDANYRADVTGRLEAALVSGIDFSDCAIPKGIFGPKEGEFFLAIEARVLELLMNHGYSHADIERMQLLRNRHDPRSKTNAHRTIGVQDEHDRLRQIARRLESELSTAQREAGRLDRGQLAEPLELKRLRTEYNMLASKLAATTMKVQSLEAALHAKEEARRSLKRALRKEEAKLAQLKNSRSWRWGRPFRKASSLVARLIARK